MTFAIRFSPDAVDHLRRLSARDRARVTRAIATMLIHEPTRESRNRKPMRTNPVATWELRVGSLRVFYRIIEAPEPTVVVAAIGMKRRDRVVIGGEEIDL